jgi:DNA-binding MarR family transcriptional regulator
MNPITKSISIIYRMTNAVLKKELAKYNIGSGQFIYLMHLYQKDGVNQDDLTQKIIMDKATTTKALKKLEDSGYIKREKDPSDKRVMRIFLTETGSAIKADILSMLDDLNKMLKEGLDDTETQMLERLLDKVSWNMLKGHNGLCSCYENEEENI